MVTTFTNDREIEERLRVHFYRTELDKQLEQIGYALPVRIRLKVQRYMTEKEWRNLVDTSDFYVINPQYSYVTQDRLVAIRDAVDSDREHVHVTSRIIDHNEHPAFSTVVQPRLEAEVHFCTDSSLYYLHEGGRMFVDEAYRDAIYKNRSHGKNGIVLSIIDHAVYGMSSPLFVQNKYNDKTLFNSVMVNGINEHCPMSYRLPVFKLPREIRDLPCAPGVNR
ncbi:MAG: hypothetical protein ACNI3A_02460 [Desulfovibrio sp.]|uniref:hypothetical protein n=1 Tax=Desulfovibrio sp. 7SRBS1 TaxID=3378064 RepID=UPI003B3E49D2